MFRYKLLIIENDPKTKEFLQESLKKSDYEVYWCADYFDIPKEFLRYNPNLVLMAINLPFYDGFYWCNRIRYLSKVPIMFISYENSHLDMNMAINLGGNDLIKKPLSQEELIKKIEILITQHYSDSLH